MKASIYDYQKASNFLRHKWDHKRTFNKSFTIRAWAKSLGMNAHSNFHQMIHGKRKLSKKYAIKIAKSLKLTSKESIYFESLIDYEWAKNKEQKEYFYERLKKLAPKRKIQFLELEAFSLLQNPLCGAIIEMTTLPDFQFSIPWIQKKLRPKISQLEVKNIIQKMINHHLLEKTQNGGLKRANDHIFSEQDIKNEALKEYHKNVLSLAADQIEKQDVLDREYVATAMAISSNDLPEIKEKIRSFLNELISEFESPAAEGDEIYQFSTQFFSLTKKDKT